MEGVLCLQEMDDLLLVRWQARLWWEWHLRPQASAHEVLPQELQQQAEKAPLIHEPEQARWPVH